MIKFLNSFVSGEVRVYFVPFVHRNANDTRYKLSDTKFNSLIKLVFDDDSVQEVNTTYSSVWGKSSSAVRAQNFSKSMNQLNQQT